MVKVITMLFAVTLAMPLDRPQQQDQSARLFDGSAAPLFDEPADLLFTDDAAEVFGDVADGPPLFDYAGDATGSVEMECHQVDTATMICVIATEKCVRVIIFCADGSGKWKVCANDRTPL